MRHTLGQDLLLLGRIYLENVGIKAFLGEVPHPGPLPVFRCVIASPSLGQSGAEGASGTMWPWFREVCKGFDDSLGKLPLLSASDNFPFVSLLL